MSAAPAAGGASLSLAALVRASEEVRATSARNGKVSIIADTLRAAGDEAGLAARYLAGDPPQDRLEVGWAAMRDATVDPARESTLTVGQVDAALQALADAGGEGSRGARLSTLHDLLSSATADEQRFLNHLVMGHMQQGANAGVITKAVAAAADVPEKVVRRALMLSADLGEVTTVALTEGRAGLEAVGLRVGRGVQPMLASTAASVPDAVTAAQGDDDTSGVVVEWKLDGARIQVHRDGDQVTVFTRNLNDITARSPDVVAAALELDVTSIILDGEILAVAADGRPSAFQDTMSAFSNDEQQVRLSPFYFDILHLDGRDLIDEPLTTRRAALESSVPPAGLVPAAVVTTGADGQAVMDEALSLGHEGVMVKDPTSPYAAGRRGKAWRKVKPVKTLDLVVLAVEWGSGRRKGWLSNIHLGARDDRPDAAGEFVMLGKTFKGMTDEMLRWQTERFLELESHRDGHVVHVRPEQVVEIALDGIQTSRRYPGGVALRFARVLRYRDDKRADQVDSLSSVRALGQTRPGG